MIVMMKEEWVAKGKKLFGDDMMKWAFECPGCHCVQTPELFRPYKDKGTTPDSAYKECLGRYVGGKSWANDKQSKPGPCDYTSYGLLNIAPILVVDGDKKIYSFAFARMKIPEEKI